ncbi:MAG: thymidine phosphorylase, partial [Planctomycetes bacterium]|nr:thymidine phosphorylase [Planctomycetota bacterium]
KLESIPGFRTDLSLPEIQRLTDQVGCVITGATQELVPADRKLYALRDVTGTVSSVPLITASILSKKLAEGLDTLVLDVKCGCGTFMKTADQARTLARSMIAVGHRLGMKTIALITDMNRPLGRAIGNAVEVEEAMQTLAGADGPDELWELVLMLASELLVASGRYASWVKAERAVLEARDSGAALEKFRQMVTAQGGDLSRPLPKAPAHELRAGRSGFIASIDAERLGRIVTDLGAGRRSLGASIDHAVGVELLVQVGDSVTSGAPIARILAPPAKAEAVREALTATFEFSDEPVKPGPRVIDRMDERNVRAAQTDSTSGPGSVRLEKADAAQPMGVDSDIERLIRAAHAARDRAYAPYSRFRVGAAVLTSDGTIATGCNVENISYGLTLCAERAAVAGAVAAGHRGLTAIAIVAEGKTTPCGACRQFLAEFGTDLAIYVADPGNPAVVRCWRLSELLPEAFRMSPSE